MAKFLMIAMSSRKDSLNKKLVTVAAEILSQEIPGHEYNVAALNDFPMPVYDGDLESQSGIPNGANQLGKLISEADGIIISTPEYNGGIPGSFKNAIDWISRISPMPWPGRHLLLIGTSPGALGAVRGLWHSRVPLEAIGVFVFPEMFGLSQAHQAFDESGRLKDSKTQERLKKVLVSFCNHTLKK